MENGSEWGKKLYYRVMLDDRIPLEVDVPDLDEKYLVELMEQTGQPSDPEMRRAFIVRFKQAIMDGNFRVIEVKR